MLAYEFQGRTKPSLRLSLKDIRNQHELMILRSGSFYAQKIVFVLVLGVGRCPVLLLFLGLPWKCPPFPPRPIHEPLPPALLPARPYFLN